MGYINHLSGYISYFDTGYWFIFFGCAGNFTIKNVLGSKGCCSTLISPSLEFAGETGLLAAR
jgi:hypothetical protein